MKGDFSRITFDPANHFSRVLLQQGRVTLDADPNEQASILLHYLRTLARDLIGPYGGPMDNFGFELKIDSSSTPAKLTIGAGRYYVDGILCESDGCDYSQQPDYTLSKPDSSGQGGDLLLAQLANPTAQTFWIYLDVWERLITWIEDDHIREVALNGPDTCARSRVVWQVKAKTTTEIVTELQQQQAAIDQLIANTTDATLLSALNAQVAKLALDLDRLSSQSFQTPFACAAPLDSLSEGNEQMAAQLDPGQQIKDPCVISPSAAYRGAENQLYRVEIHQGTASGAKPTFKWSRDNGSVATRWLGTDGNDLLVTSARGFAAGNWVELSDDRLDLQGAPGLLVKLAKVQNDRLSVDPDSIPQNQSIAWTQQLSNPKARRWDQTENDNITLAQGAVPIVESTTVTNPTWIDLEDGLQVQFAAGGTYRSGDYWLIPARVATGTIDWPANPNGTLLKAPHGVRHHYAPLGFLSWSAPQTGTEGGGFVPSDCRCSLVPSNTCQRASTAPAAVAKQRSGTKAK
jgi:hypothetical protein